MKPPSTGNGQYPIRALQHGLSILDAILEAERPLSLDQIVTATGISKSTAFRMIVNLIHAGFVVQAPTGYWLGLKLLRMGTLVSRQLDLREQALPCLTRLRNTLNETVHLAVLDHELRVLYLEKLVAVQPIGIMMSRVGVTTPVHCTALGKAIAAFKPEAEIQAFLDEHPLRRFTQHTITDPQAFLAELKAIRERGYSIDFSEHEAEVRCIAAPLRDHSGEVVAAISVAGPAGRMPDPLVGSPMAEEVVRAANDISRAIGYHASQDSRQPARR